MKEEKKIILFGNTQNNELNESRRSIINPQFILNTKICVFAVISPKRNKSFFNFFSSYSAKPDSSFCVVEYLTKNGRGFDRYDLIENTGIPIKIISVSCLKLKIIGLNQKEILKILKAEKDDFSLVYDEKNFAWYFAGYHQSGEAVTMYCSELFSKAISFERNNFFKIALQDLSNSLNKETAITLYKNNELKKSVMVKIRELLGYIGNDCKGDGEARIMIKRYSCNDDISIKYFLEQVMQGDNFLGKSWQIVTNQANTLLEKVKIDQKSFFRYFKWSEPPRGKLIIGKIIDKAFGFNHDSDCEPECNDYNSNAYMRSLVNTLGDPDIKLRGINVNNQHENNYPQFLEIDYRGANTDNEKVSALQNNSDSIIVIHNNSSSSFFESKSSSI